MNSKMAKISSVEKLCQSNIFSHYHQKIQKCFIIKAIKEAINIVKSSPQSTANVDDIVIKIAKDNLDCLLASSLKKVINATGVILNTNIGRAPLSESIISNMSEIAKGYCNLEVDLNSGARKSRQDHVWSKINFLTGSEDSLVVNNNAAALILTLNTLSFGKEVLISRGELVEIGDSFRIHEIIEASGTVLKEVGSTNKTTLSDYEKAISKDTGAILKVHRSNFSISGFTQEVKIQALVEAFSKTKKIPVIYDLGSGLLDKNLFRDIGDEPDICSALLSNCDIVTFSCDKLLGGPQAGIIAGKEKLISKMRKNPFNRGFRPCKLTLYALTSLFSLYLDQKPDIPIMTIANQDKESLLKRAEMLSKKIARLGVECGVVNSLGKFGGETLPDHNIDSYWVLIKSFPKEISHKELYTYLRNNKKVSIFSNLKKGLILFDILTISDEDVDDICNVIMEALK